MEARLGLLEPQPANTPAIDAAARTIPRAALSPSPTCLAPLDPSNRENPPIEDISTILKPDCLAAPSLFGASTALGYQAWAGNSLSRRSHNAER